MTESDYFLMGVKVITGSTKTEVVQLNDDGHIFDQSMSMKGPNHHRAKERNERSEILLKSVRLKGR